MTPTGPVSPRTASTGPRISRKTAVRLDTPCSTWWEASRKPFDAARSVSACSTGGTERLPTFMSPMAASQRIPDSGSARSETKSGIAAGAGIWVRALAASQRRRTWELPSNATSAGTAGSPIVANVSRARWRVPPSRSPSCAISSSNRWDSMSEASMCLRGARPSDQALQNRQPIAQYAVRLIPRKPDSQARERTSDEGSMVPCGHRFK